MGIENILIKAGRHEVILPVSESQTIILGGTAGSLPEVRELESSPLIDVMGMDKVPLPQGKVNLVRLPYGHLTLADATEDEASGELILHKNGGLRAGAYWQSDGQWSQYGIILPAYMGEGDLIDVAYSSEISGKGIDILVSEYVKPEPKKVNVAYPSEIADSAIRDVWFPGRWDDDTLAHNITVTTDDAIYTIGKRILPRKECDALLSMAQSAIEYHTGNPGMGARLDTLRKTYADIVKYSKHDR